MEEIKINVPEGRNARQTDRRTNTDIRHTDREDREGERQTQTIDRQRGKEGTDGGRE